MVGLASLGLWYLRGVIVSFEQLNAKQNDFNANLMRIETKVVTEIEHLKIFTVQLLDRIKELEK